MTTFVTTSTLNRVRTIFKDFHFNDPVSQTCFSCENVLIYLVEGLSDTVNFGGGRHTSKGGLEFLRPILVQKFERR